MSAQVHPLKDNQALAVDPRDSVWLSASAGTGKTQVLSARVLRLLLEPGTSPEQILCLTFTKAGAAEMATRVNEVLANWVRMPETDLARQLDYVGAPIDPATIARARTLFAAVLDCPGGGLRIDTIHAFSQWLLATFPQEAELIPGTRPMEDRDRDLLARRVLADLLEEWQDSDPAAVAALEMLSVRLDPDRVRQWLMRCAVKRSLWFGPGAWQPPMRNRVAALLGLPADANVSDFADGCADGAPAVECLRRIMWAYDDWGTPSGQKFSSKIGEWLLSSPEDRFRGCPDLQEQLFNKDGVLKHQNNLVKAVPEAEVLAEQGKGLLKALADRAILLELVDFLTPALEIGRKFALAWDAAKVREGLVDFDDLIERAAALLGNQDMSAWIRYKLDRQFDHVLVDEAQDTNREQWDIIEALTDDFFSGLGAAGDKLRTIFVVGDYKQAIFGFQGTSPENFARQRQRYKELLGQRAANARAMRQNIIARDLRTLGLGRSYRTAQSVLTFVDQAIATIGHEAFGLDQKPDDHVGQTRPGMVTLWQPVSGQAGEDEGEGPELRVSAPERQMAERIAAQIKQWWHGGFPLAKGKPRNATPGDFMVLVRKRRELAGLIVARLHAAGVPVAGVDRLRLGAPLAVQDLMAALRFAVQPRDDLSLASLLVSPLLGWSHEDLLAHGWRGKDVPLWDHLRRTPHPQAKAAVAALRELLARADFQPPQALLHWMLVGPWQGRRRLLARLGGEASDPIDELLNAALQFAATHTPSLQGFIHWFDAAEDELKREAEGDGDMVRVMTVHGSKGLQAPIVILADACGNPVNSRPSGLELEETLPGGEKRTAVPLTPLSKSEQVGPIAEAAQQAAQADKEEHWRLLYVAMTRAEEALFIGGALGKSEKEPADDSWYARLAPLFTGDELADPLWGARRELGAPPPPVPGRTQQELPIPPVLPPWATSPIGSEPRPPRPLAPSSAAAEDQSADPPLPPGQAALAARRGVLIHALLERLPDTPPDLREAGGRAWLARHGADLEEAERQAMLESALAVLAQPEWQPLFGPDALPEVPLAAIVGEEVISGTVDRLLVLPERVLVVDFKTARRPPQSVATIPAATLAQMAAYVAALEVIYPGREVAAAVLYTQVPALFALPAELLARHKPGLAQPQQSFPQAPLPAAPEPLD